MSFFDKLGNTNSSSFSVCVGIDPTPDALQAWGLDDSADGARRFSLAMLEAAENAVPVVKPQVAYFERFGAEGYNALADVIHQARRKGLLVLADAKRGDIGSTMNAYANAWIGSDAPLQADALTVVPYLGFGSLQPLLKRAHDCGAYVFVVARSSNFEGTSVQTLGSPQVWKTILNEIAAWEKNHGNKTIGAVVGATVPEDLRFALEYLPDAYFLAPGVGQQGADLNRVRNLTKDRRRIIISSSRSLAAKGPNVGDIQEAISLLR